MQLVCQHGNLADEGSFWCRNCTRGCAPNQLSLVLEPTEQIDDFTIVERIAVFPTSALYHATRNKRPVLLKVAHKDRQDCLKREMQLLWQMERHPAFLHPLSASVSESRPYGKFALRGEMKYYAVYEDVRGPLARALLNANPQPATRYVGWLTLGLVDAMMFLHGNYGQAVRNLSPDNILVRHDRQGIPRPIFLDLSQLTAFHEVSQPVSSSAAYVTPEELQGQSIGSYTDVYGIGLFMYEMLAGQPAFDSRQKRDEEIRATILGKGPRPLSEIRPDLDRALISVTEKATQRFVQDRTSNVQGLARDLLPIWGKLPIEKGRFDVGLNPITIGLIGGLIILLFAILMILM